MPFLIGTQPGDTGPKQHLNLSPLAMDIMENDMLLFGVEKKGSFLNRVIENYGVEASISRHLEQMEEHLRKTFSNGKEGVLSEIQEKTLKLLLEERTRELLAIKLSYPKSPKSHLTFTLNKTNTAFLSLECREDLYYGKEYKGKYIKAVLEEYSRLPFAKREQIYFRSYCENIKEARETGRTLRVKNDQGTYFKVWVYGLETDLFQTASYLTGYSLPLKEPDQPPVICSFRLFAIKELSLWKQSREKGALTLAQDKAVQEAIAKRGAPFLLLEEEKIQVRFTKVGEYKFRRQLYLRPSIFSKEGDVYTFYCTKTQAQFYFFKFGEDARILSPPDLREKFKKMYQAAAACYDAPTAPLQ